MSVTYCKYDKDCSGDTPICLEYVCRPDGMEGLCNKTCQRGNISQGCSKGHCPTLESDGTGSLCHSNFACTEDDTFCDFVTKKCVKSKLKGESCQQWNPRSCEKGLVCLREVSKCAEWSNTKHGCENVFASKYELDSAYKNEFTGFKECQGGISYSLFIGLLLASLFLLATIILVLFFVIRSKRQMNKLTNDELSMPVGRRSEESNAFDTAFGQTPIYSENPLQYGETQFDVKRPSVVEDVPGYEDNDGNSFNQNEKQ